MSETTVDPKYIVNLKGKSFCTYAGLLDLAHKVGLSKIETEMLSCTPGEIVIFKATVTMGAGCEDEKVFVGHGDATPTNVNSLIAQHMIRMAETRAVARALRSATNTGMAALEELGGAKSKVLGADNK